MVSKIGWCATDLAAFRQHVPQDFPFDDDGYFDGIRLATIAFIIKLFHGFFGCFFLYYANVSKIGKRCSELLYYISQMTYPLSEELKYSVPHSVFYS